MFDEKGGSWCALAAQTMSPISPQTTCVGADFITACNVDVECTHAQPVPALSRKSCVCVKRQLREEVVPAA